MVVFSNYRLGPRVELLVSREVASELVREVAAAAGAAAQARWEHELASWLERWAAAGAPGFDVSEIAWTPEHFERQRSFLTAAIASAMTTSRNARALARWSQMIEAHPRESVQFGRRWQLPIAQTTN